MTRVLSSVLEVLGLLAIVAGATLFDYRAGIVVLGVALVVIAWIMDRGPARPDTAAADGEASQ